MTSEQIRGRTENGDKSGKFARINKGYWSEIPAGQIVGRNAFPGEELFSQLEQGVSILDLGCGTGEMSGYLSQRGYKVTGIDINTDAISQNSLKTSEIEYVQGDITGHLPFEDKSFDAITISFVMVNILPLSAREELVRELSRILKSGGVIWINEGLISSDYDKRYKLSKPLLGGDTDFFVFDEGISSLSVETQQQLEQVIQAGGVARIVHHFSIEELKGLFNEFEVVNESESKTLSPHSKSTIKMTTMVFKHKN